MEKEITNMVQEIQETERQSSGFVGILGGLIIGSVAGAVAMLLLAPQSGKKTRMLIQDKGIELRDRATGMVDEAFEQVRSNTSKMTTSGLQKADELKQQGQDLLEEQVDRVSAAARAGKKAIQNVLS
jgi:gas vesicle protein